MNVDKLPVRWDDKQETFLLSETLKYLFLLFSDSSVLPLNEALVKNALGYKRALALDLDYISPGYFVSTAIMSEPHHDDHEADLNPTTTAGYKVGQQKTVDEYATLDAHDESLNRWKASIGIGADAAGPAKVVVESLYLTSPSLPPGKTVALNLTNPASIEACKHNPITIKEGTEYSVCLKFLIQGTVVSGLRYLHVVKRAGIKVDKLEQMIGSFGPQAEPRTVTFVTEESPSGMFARSGTYDVTSRVYDDDKNVHADFSWKFKLAKEW
ncbi:hypothetical protein FRC10_010518 [Ceratobasidium sp. 414]|nr:hypothetical protein FRC10_010518 [Ceratobasidium sp. 414]